jgi:hypothetical protein
MTKNLNQDIIEKFDENFEDISNTYKITQENPENDLILKQKTNLTILKYAAIEQIPAEFAIIGISALLQSGAYLKSVPNRRIKINNHEFTKKSLVFAAEQAEFGQTLRSMARHLRKTIAKVAYKYEIPGHLYAKFKIENANIIAQNDSETNKIIATYCTDFQIENPDTPEIVREFLANREKTRSSKK